jgi:hypothetical protein
MEMRLVQARRPNKIKKATKTPEERRKEMGLWPKRVAGQGFFFFFLKK